MPEVSIGSVAAEEPAAPVVSVAAAGSGAAIGAGPGAGTDACKHSLIIYGDTY